MDIVKQRRKRLMAWILALVLCVGMWQGSVYAEGDEGGDIPAVTEGEDENIDSQSTEPAAEPVVKVLVKDCSGEPVKPRGTLQYKKDENSEVISAKLIEDNTETYFEINGNISLSNITYESGDTQHHILGWHDSNDKPLENGITISAGTTVQIILGKNLVVFYWDGANSANATYLQTADTMQWKPNDIKHQYDNGMSAYWESEAEISEDGMEGTAKEYKPGTWYNYEGFEDEINLYSKYELVTGGDFELVSRQKYKLGLGSWSIDEYTYSGGVDFYVPEEGTYSFKK